MIDVSFKKLHPDATMPTKATDGSNGLDLTATNVSKEQDPLGNNHLHIIHTGIAVQIPKGYVGLLFSRSSIANKSFSLANAVGVLDNDYTGEITFKFRYTGNGQQFWHQQSYNEGDRIGQLLIVPSPEIKMIEVKELKETKRGPNGYGSTGA